MELSTAMSSAELHGVVSTSEELIRVKNTQEFSS